MQTVLLVEDEKLERMYLKRLFEREIAGYQVVGESLNGREAIDFVKNHSPDIIFMDVKMPGIDGLKATQAIKAMHPQVHIIILTAYDEFKFAREALRAGAEEYLLKPARPGDIVKALNSLHQYSSISQDFSQDLLGLAEKMELSNYNKEKILIMALQNNNLKLLDVTLDEYFSELLQLVHLPSALKVHLFEFISLLMRTLCDLGFAPDKVHELKIRLYAKVALIESFPEAHDCMALIKQELVSVSKGNDSSKKELMQSILNYLKANIAADISMESISEYFHFSSSHLSRLIKKETGFTYPEYINHIRLSEAKILLRNSTMNINRIAQEIGYREVPHFNRVFKKAIGISPTKYRELFLNELPAGFDHQHGQEREARKMLR